MCLQDLNNLNRVTYLDWWYQQKRVNYKNFIVSLTGVILKSPGASKPLCRIPNTGPSLGRRYEPNTLNICKTAMLESKTVKAAETSEFAQWLHKDLNSSPSHGCAVKRISKWYLIRSKNKNKKKFFSQPVNILDIGGFHRIPMLCLFNTGSGIPFKLSIQSIFSTPVHFALKFSIFNILLWCSAKASWTKYTYLLKTLYFTIKALKYS